MTERRQILTGALALAAAPITFPVFASADASPARAWATPQPALFLYDQNFEVARRHARHLQAAGSVVVGFKEDLLPLWTGQLQALWKAGPAVVGGLTNANALFLLETLAADHRLKLAYRDELQSVDEGEPLFHWLLVPRHTA